MQFALLFADSEETTARYDDPAQRDELMQGWMVYMGAMAEAGVMRSGEELKAPNTATTVRRPAGETVVQDGPYCEAKEYLGGFVVIEVESLDDAISWAEKCPAAVTGSVEIRPVVIHEEP